ncbi:MAG: amidohydrolase family protein [Bacteroidetes bacterium]|nr:amidohydrolase family protein [Bacteroidota bacterium]
MENPPIRTRIIAFIITPNAHRNLGEWAGFDKNPTSLVYVSGTKYIIDGTPNDESSLSSKPYDGRPGWFGRFDFAKDTIRQILKDGLAGKDQLMMHVVGDSAVTAVLRMMKMTADYSRWRPKRVRIEHNHGYSSNIDEEENEIKSLSLLMMHTPMYCRESPVRSLIKKGIKVGISPDGLTNPFVNIMIVCSQQTNTNENITREEAVIAYTKNNAYAEFAENIKGTLTRGKLADLAVLSQDIFTIPLDKLPETKSLLTMVGGKIIYSANEMNGVPSSK